MVAAAVLAGVAGATGAVSYFTGPIPIDEWQCARNEVPVFHGASIVDGQSCLPPGAELPKGWTWDPLGNRPMACESRYGWYQIRPSGKPGGSYDCARSGEALPEGWVRAAGS